jgi:3-oxoacyl-[acyl-carrier protein] reductase
VQLSGPGRAGGSRGASCDHVSLGRPAEPDEIGVAALFLADPENSYTNGHVLTVDGGWTAGYARDF